MHGAPSSIIVLLGQFVKLAANQSHLEALGGAEIIDDACGLIAKGFIDASHGNFDLMARLIAAEQDQEAAMKLQYPEKFLDPGSQN